MLWTQLPQIWTALFVNAICDGNELYDDLFGDTAVYLDVEDVAQSLGTDCNVQSISTIFGFSNANDVADLVLHVTNVQQLSYGVIIVCKKSVVIYIQTNGLCALSDSTVHKNNGPSRLINAYLYLFLFLSFFLLHTTHPFLDKAISGITKYTHT